VETKGVLTLTDNTVIVDGDFLFYVWRQSQKTILWDMDGVIVDSSSFHFAAWQETFVQRGVKFTQENFRRKATGGIKPFPGVVRLLNAIKKGNFKLGLVSATTKENIDLVLRELNLAGIFDGIVFGQEVSESKPSPQIYLLAAKKLAVAPNDCLVIEDSPLGVKAAKTAGMKCLAITNTHPRQEFKEADKIVDSLENVDLITLLTRV
jgi:HAD superfamily hydrolase (TIGR01509 family)